MDRGLGPPGRVGPVKKFLRALWDLLVRLFKDARSDAAHYSRPVDQPGRRTETGPVRRNPWVKCPQCYKPNPSLCDVADDGAEPCGLGVRCGCCTGPHVATKEKAR